MVDVPHSLLFRKISEVRSYRLQCTLGNVTLRCVCFFSRGGGVGVAQSLWFPGPLVPWSWSSGPLVPWSSGPLVLWSPGPLVPWSSGAWLRLLEGYKYCKLQSSVLQKARKSARYKYNICGVFHASTQAQCQPAPAKKLPVLIFIQFCNWGDWALPNLPRYFARQAQSETNPSKGCNNLAVLIFANVLQMLRRVSTMHKTAYNKAQEAACSHVLILVHVV